MRTYRCEEIDIDDETREELAALARASLNEWLARGNHCIHAPAGQACDTCRADYEADPSAWWEYGQHPEGEANAALLMREIEEDAKRLQPPIEVDPEIPF